MSTPQDPGDTPDNPTGPPNPADPQNPYGTPPPPTPDVPPPAATPPAYGDPTAPPPYGDPSAPPPFGQQPYGQPVPGQPGYPQYGVPPTPEAPKGMAITALIVSFFGCTCLGAVVSIVLSIIVLRRGKDGRNHGKGLAIAAMVISVISLLIGLGVAGLITYASQFESVDDLKAGQCITAKGLADEDAEAVTEIKTVSCSDEHDGEVLATAELSADQAENSATAQAEDVCTPALEAAGKLTVITEGINVTALTAEEPEAGDTAACVAYNIDGSKLTARLGS